MHKYVLPIIRSSLFAVGLILLIGTHAQAAPQVKSANSKQVQNVVQANSVAINRLNFAIPFTLKSEAAQVVEVLLFESTDRGRTWQLHSRQNPNAKQFPYSCANDGEYWFSVRSQNRDGAMIPAGQLFPELKITVDTRKPELEFEVRPDAAGRVVGAWKADDANLDPDSLKIQYQGDSGEWIDVPQAAAATSSSVYQNQLAWWPQTAGGQLSVRAEIRDKAGNSALVERKIAIPQVANMKRLRATPAADAPTQQHRQQASQQEQQSAPTRFASNDSRAFPSQGASFEAPPPPQEGNQNQVQPMTPLPVPVANGSTQPQVWNSQVKKQSGQNQVVAGSTNSATWRSQPADGQPSQDNRVVTEGSTLQRTSDGFNRPAQSQSSQAQTSLSSYQTNGSPENDQTKNQPAVSTVSSGSDGNRLDSISASARPINSQQFSLDYEIDAVGPSGVKDVVLWGTTDGGRSWKSWSVDEDRTSPFKVEVPQNGIYGFRIVISSNDGLRGRSPRPGEQADVWLRVDTNAPKANIVSAPYGETTEVGKLIINWQAADEALALRPINLSFSRRPIGPWTKIEHGLRNESRFVWKPELQTPDLVYIKLEARDMAGNVTTDITDQPVDISGLKPRGHIRDVRPILSGN